MGRVGGSVEVKAGGAGGKAGGRDRRRFKLI